MKRKILAAVIAVSLHGALLIVKLPEIEKKPPELAEFKTLNFSLVEAPALLPKQNSQERPETDENKKPVPEEKKKPIVTPPPQKASIPVRERAPERPKKIKAPVPAPKQEPIPSPDEQKNVLGETSASVGPSSAPSGNTMLNDKADDREVKNTIPSSQVIHEARPLYLENPSPRYPMVARKRKYEGLVMLEVFVDTEGRVMDRRILETSGYSVLDTAALKGVSTWRFKPAQRGNQAISMWVRVPIRFRLQD